MPADYDIDVCMTCKSDRSFKGDLFCATCKRVLHPEDLQNCTNFELIAEGVSMRYNLRWIVIARGKRTSAGETRVRFKSHVRSARKRGYTSVVQRYEQDPVYAQSMDDEQGGTVQAIEFCTQCDDLWASMNLRENEKLSLIHI